MPSGTSVYGIRFHEHFPKIRSLVLANSYLLPTSSQYRKTKSKPAIRFDAGNAVTESCTRSEPRGSSFLTPAKSLGDVGIVEQFFVDYFLCSHHSPSLHFFVRFISAYSSSFTDTFAYACLPFLLIYLPHVSRTLSCKHARGSG